MNEGDKVTIYEDPLTEEKSEGYARLVSQQGFEGVFEGRLLETWLVNFENREHTYPRFRSILEPRLYNQSAFDIAASHLLRQGKVCEVDGRMMFRCGSLRSAIGSLIPDELYETAMDLMDESDDIQGITIPTLLEEFPPLKERFRDVDVNLLERLGEIHDIGKGVERHWKMRLISLAREYELNPLKVAE